MDWYCKSCSLGRTNCFTDCRKYWRLFLLAVVAGSLVTAIIVGLWKKEYVGQDSNSTDNADIDLNTEEF